MLYFANVKITKRYFNLRYFVLRVDLPGKAYWVPPRRSCLSKSRSLPVQQLPHRTYLTNLMTSVLYNSSSATLADNNGFPSPREIAVHPPLHFLYITVTTVHLSAYDILASSSFKNSQHDRNKYRIHSFRTK
jgi:hypothetical protein